MCSEERPEECSKILVNFNFAGVGCLLLTALLYLIIISILLMEEILQLIRTHLGHPCAARFPWVQLQASTSSLVAPVEILFHRNRC